MGMPTASKKVRHRVTLTWASVLLSQCLSADVAHLQRVVHSFRCTTGLRFTKVGGKIEGMRKRQQNLRFGFQHKSRPVARGTGLKSRGAL